MENVVIGSFRLKTFSGKTYKFDVYDNGLMFCGAISMYQLYRIVLKPVFELFGLDENGNKNWIFIQRSDKNDYIESIEINDDLFYYMKDNNMIMYSTDMSFLYNLPDKIGYDGFHQKRAFKHVKDKAKILSKQRRGYYN